jgi:hypothetical protein
MWLAAAHESRVPVSSGTAFRIDSPPENGIVTGNLARELQNVFERFAREAAFDGQRGVGIFLRPGIFGHHKVGRAADIYSVGGVGLDVWKGRWDEAQRRARTALDDKTQRAILANERRCNLGWRLYKALQLYGCWSQPYGYPVQLFGPWTRSEGPWKCISDFLLNAHRDHIHVAK